MRQSPGFPDRGDDHSMTTRGFFERMRSSRALARGSGMILCAVSLFVPGQFSSAETNFLLRHRDHRGIREERAFEPNAFWSLRRRNGVVILRTARILSPPGRLREHEQSQTRRWRVPREGVRFLTSVQTSIPGSQAGRCGLGFFATWRRRGRTPRPGDPTCARAGPAGGRGGPSRDGRARRRAL